MFPYLDYYGEESGLIRFDFGLDDLVSGTLNDGVHEKQFEISKFVDPGTLEMEQIVLGGVLENENWDFDWSALCPEPQDSAVVQIIHNYLDIPPYGYEIFQRN